MWKIIQHLKNLKDLKTRVPFFFFYRSVIYQINNENISITYNNKLNLLFLCYNPLNLIKDARFS